MNVRGSRRPARLITQPLTVESLSCYPRPQVNVRGIVLAGSADFKNDLHQSDIFDPRLVAKVMKTVDVSYGGENGFNQARDEFIRAGSIMSLLTVITRDDRRSS